MRTTRRTKTTRRTRTKQRDEQSVGARRPCSQRHPLFRRNGRDSAVSLKIRLCHFSYERVSGDAQSAHARSSLRRAARLLRPRPRTAGLSAHRAPGAGPGIGGAGVRAGLAALARGGTRPRPRRMGAGGHARVRALPLAPIPPAATGNRRRCPATRPAARSSTPCSACRRRTGARSCCTTASGWAYGRSRPRRRRPRPPRRTVCATRARR